MTAEEKADRLADVMAIAEGVIGREAALPRLRELLQDPEAQVRVQAATAAARYPADREVVAALLSLAEDDDAHVRLEALAGLGAVITHGELAGAEGASYAPDRDAEEPDPDDYAQARAKLLTALGREGAEGATALLALAVLSGDDRVVAGIEALWAADRRSALRCMGRSGDPRWAEAVREGLEADGAELLAAAVEAAGRIELTSAAPLLGRILRGARQPVPVRVRAAHALARLGGKVAGPALLEVAEGDPVTEVQEAARVALADLTLMLAPTGAAPEEDA
jgi:HEAT repeat protein